MSIFKKKAVDSQYNVVTDDYKPATLPWYGEALNTFVTGSYSMTKSETLQEQYKACESGLEQVMATCDRHSKGNEGDSFIEGQHIHLLAMHKVEVAAHEHQAERILAARKTRTETLVREKETLEAERDTLKSKIEPLKDLRSQFQLRFGNRRLSLGVVITTLAMIVDACVNWSFLQSILLSNSLLLLITVICMSVMSDGSMWALGTFISHKEEKFTSRPLYYIICSGLVAMFALSVVTSVMIRYGSMAATYGTVNAAGEFVGKDSYSLAEYGVTLITAFVTTATGILSFAFSLDKNAHLVTLRKSLENQLKLCDAHYDLVCAELADLETAPDPMELDRANREAAEQNIEALRVNLKLHLRKLVTLQQNDPTFTEKMAASGSELTNSFNGSFTTVLPVSLNKAS